MLSDAMSWFKKFQRHHAPRTPPEPPEDQGITIGPGEAAQFAVELPKALQDELHGLHVQGAKIEMAQSRSYRFKNAICTDIVVLVDGHVYAQMTVGIEPVK